ncbi:MAG: TolC family protein [candidate division Zixibacteria bacterium]|nr:TolC family protein [candidate division Zixibacteria bacterium]
MMSALKRYRLGLLIMAVLGAPAAAGTHPLTLDDCIRMGMEHSPALHGSLMKIDGAKAQLGEVNAARLPALSLSAGYTRLSEIDPFAVMMPGATEPFTFFPNIPNNYSGKLTLTQPLFTGLQLENTSSALKRNLQATRLDHEAASRELRFDITDAFWNVVKANDYQTIIDEDVKRQEVHLKDVQGLFEQGLVSRNDVLRVEVQHSNALLQQISAHNGLELAKANLENVIGAPLPDDIDMTTPGESVDSIGMLSALQVTALANRPEAKAISQRVEMGKNLVGAAKSGWLPQVALVANYAYMRPNQRIQPLKDEAKSTWDVGVYLSYNLWDWNTTGHKAKQAKAELAQLRDAERQVFDGITLQVTHNYLTLQEVTKRIEVSRMSLQQADEGYRITHDLYQQGMAKTSDLLDASVLQTQAAVNHSQALIDYQTAKARLETTVGK